MSNKDDQKGGSKTPSTQHSVPLSLPHSNTPLLQSSNAPRVVHNFAELSRFASKTCLAIGVFDGLHLGHQAVLRTAMDDAAQCGATAVAVTFDPHPVRVLAPERAPRLLTSTQHKLELIGQLGVTTCVVVKFDEAFAQTPAEDFVTRHVYRAPQVQAICVGAGFRFGKERAGNVSLLRSLSTRLGYRLHALPSVKLDNVVISSTAVRQAVLKGELNLAQRMLGRPFSLLGTVVEGDRLARTLGYPTANLNRHNEVAPPHGVYAVRARIGPEFLPGILNIGVRPTVKQHQTGTTVELHVLDFEGDLYGRDIEVFFVERLRDEKKFSSLEDLKAQIQRDEMAARKMLASSLHLSGK